MLKLHTFEKRLLIGLLVFFLSASFSPIGTSEIIQQHRGILYVGGDGPGNYSTVGEAMINATNGDTIFVFNGVYLEHVAIYKQVHLIGEDNTNTIIDGNGSGYVLSISDEMQQVVVSDFTIRNGDSGIYIDTQVTNCTISHNVVVDNKDHGIYASGKVEYNIISDNIVARNHNGTSLGFASYNEITGNTFEDNEEYGLTLVLWCNENEIHNNNFIGNKAPAFFFLSSLNNWFGNYWGRPRLLPKAIFGLMGILPWINIDWRPRLTPYAS